MDDERMDRELWRLEFLFSHTSIKPESDRRREPTLAPMAQSRLNMKPWIRVGAAVQISASVWPAHAPEFVSKVWPARPGVRHAYKAGEAARLRLRPLPTRPRHEREIRQNRCYDKLVSVPA